jgi:hypothetical protein
MKKTFLTALVTMLAMASVTASAGERSVPVSGTVTGTATQQQNSTSGAVNAGNNQGITFNSPAQPTNTSVSTVGAAGSAFLTTSDGTCQGSQHLSAGWLGAAAAEGSTYTVLPCNNRMDALVMNGLGDAETGVQVMCTSSNVYLARKALGKPCYLKPSLITVAIPGGMPLPTGSIETYAPAHAAPVVPAAAVATEIKKENAKRDANFKRVMAK